LTKRYDVISVKMMSKWQQWTGIWSWISP